MNPANNNPSLSSSHLSLLSRGVGDLQRQVTNLVHEKIKVHLEPQDCYARREAAAAARTQPSKTFTTRRGALLLFSEDYGASYRHLNRRQMRQRKRLRRFLHRRHRLGGVEVEEEDEEGEEEDEEGSQAEREGLRTVDDLAKSILSYGSSAADDVNLRFVHPRNPKKIVRPGFSARRYLCSLTNHFDDEFVSKMVASGHLSEKTLYQQSNFLPNLRRRIKDDLSLFPPPYRIMKQMLIAAGPLHGFTFVWNRREPSESEESTEESTFDGALSEGDIRLVQTDLSASGGPVGGPGPSREVSYAQLDTTTQREVLTNLLVKSAINHAIKRHEKIEDPLAAGKQEPPGMIDMIIAVKDLLDEEAEAASVAPPRAQRAVGFRGRALRTKPESLASSRLTPMAPEFGPLGAVSRSISRGPSPPVSVRPPQPPVIQLPAVTDQPLVTIAIDGDDDDKRPQAVPESDIESIANSARVGASIQTLNFAMPQMSQSLSSTRPRSHVASLPRRTPAGKLKPRAPEVKKEDREIDPGHLGKVTITFNGLDIQHGAMSQQEISSRTTLNVIPLRDHMLLRSGAQSTQPEEEKEGEEETKEEPEGFLARYLQEKKANQSKLQAPVKERISSSTASQLGVDLHGGDIDAMPSITQWHYSDHARSSESDADGASGGPPLTSEALMALLTGHADEVAQRVLMNADGGFDLAKDVKEAIRQIIMQRDAENGHMYSDEEYKNLIKEALRSVVAQSMGGMNIPDDMELSDEILARLTDPQGLLAEEMVIEIDPETGKPILRLRRRSVVGGQKFQVVSRPKYGPNGEIIGYEKLNIPILPGMGEAGDYSAEALAAAYAAAGFDPSTGTFPPGTTFGPGGIPIIPGMTFPPGMQFPPGTTFGPGGVPILPPGMTFPPGMQFPPGTTFGPGGVPILPPGMTFPPGMQFPPGTTFGPGGVPILPPGMTFPPGMQFPPGTTFGPGGVPILPPGMTFPPGTEFPPGTTFTAGGMPIIPGMIYPPGTEFPPGTQFGPNGEVLAGPGGRGPGRGVPRRLYDAKGRTGSTDEGSEVTDRERSTLSRPGLGGRKTSDKDEFLVGKYHDKDELKRLYGQPEGAEPPEQRPKKPGVPRAADGKKKKKKTSKSKKKDSKSKRKSGEGSDSETTLGEGTEESSDYMFLDDEFSTSDGEGGSGKEHSGGDRRRHRRHQGRSSTEESVLLPGETEEEAALRKLSQREQREAKRKADAERRRQEVERRRLEKVDAKRREAEEAERQAAMEAEMEEERLRRESEFRLRKQQEREARDRAQEAQYQADLLRQRQKEREAREREELIRRMEEMRQFQAEEAERKRLEEERLAEEEARRLQEEKEMLALMSEAERVEYERKKREEAERKQREEEEARLKREEEARKAMEEARRLAEEMARKRAMAEARRKFVRGLQVELMGLQRSSRISAAYVYSYFDLLQWLGLELPMFEEKKR